MKQIKMNKTVGVLVEGETYPLMPEYGNELNECVNCEQDPFAPCIPLFMDKLPKHRLFDYVNNTEGDER
jgi:hypothetical protein